MFTLNYTKAIILKTSSLGEADKLYTLYTEKFGRIVVRGRSIRKGKLHMGMNLFSLVEVGFIQGKSYNTLTDVVGLFNFSRSRKSLSKLSLFYRISETLLFLIHGEEKEDSVFNLILDTMYEVENRNLSTREISLVHTYFSFRLLDLLGYRPVTEECVVCKKELDAESYFSSSLSGVVCSHCSKVTPFCIFIGEPCMLQRLFSDDISFVLQQNSSLLGRLLEEYLYSGLLEKQ